MMSLSEIFFWGIVLYLLYKFIFNFCLPIARTTRQVREQFRNMQGNQQDATGPFQQQYTQQRQPTQSQPKKPEPSPKNTMGEYIDFEEIK
ncbi:MAG: DUF4834 family protein [Bacteroidota bacterium]